MTRVVSLVLFSLIHLGLSLAVASGDEGSLKEVQTELKAMKSPHPWAGDYQGPGGLTGEYLLIAPSGLYCSVEYFDMGPTEVPYCGRVRFNGERFEKVGRSKDGEGGYPNGPPFLLIRWGKRKYIVPEGRIMDFISDVNAAHEPRFEHSMSGSLVAFLRSEDTKLLVVGKPEVPERYRRFLLDKPLRTRVIRVAPRTDIIKRTGRHEEEDCGADAVFDAGTSSGAFPGMRLHALSGDVQADAVISTVAQSYSEGRIKQDCCDTTDPFAAGAEFSTRYQWTLSVELSTEPLRMELHFAPGKRFPPLFSGEPQKFYGNGDEEPFYGADKAGFSWEKVGEADFIGHFKGALQLPEIQRQITRAILSMGGNIVIAPLSGRELEAEQIAMGVAELYRTTVYRLSYQGQPIAPSSDFMLSLKTLPLRRGEPLRFDWHRGAVGARADMCALPMAKNVEERMATLELLRWDEQALASAASVRFEDLQGERRSAAESFVPEARRHGYVWPALYADGSTFPDRVAERVEKVEKEFKAAHPEQAAECGSLHSQAWKLE